MKHLAFIELQLYHADEWELTDMHAHYTVTFQKFHEKGKGRAKHHFLTISSCLGRRFYAILVH